MEGSLLGGIGIVLQARMGSTRLPGKVMRLLNGRPLLEWVIARLKRMTRPSVLILATSVLPEEKPLHELAAKWAVPVFCGSENDLLDRYYQCCRQFELAHVIRATGDNPFVDPTEGDRLVDLHLATGADYSCAFPEFGSGFPIGVGLEIFTFAALERSWLEGKSAKHREHVNEYIHEHLDRFRVFVLCASHEMVAPDLSLTVDTLDDFRRAEMIYAACLSGKDDEFVPVEGAVSKARQCG